MSLVEFYDPATLFSDEIFFSDKPMSDEEFVAFVRAENDEIPIETVDFSSPVLI